MRVRIKFAKKESVQYLGHLDILRFFQRCFNRADVRMEYSEGFNPHQRMSFAQPLGVGIVSSGEYLDAEIADGQDLKKICERLNEVCGEGFEVLSVRAVKEGAKKVMAAVRYASYRVEVSGLISNTEKTESEFASLRKDPEDVLRKAIEKLLVKDRITVIKRTKSGEREVDIRPQMMELSLEKKDQKSELKNACAQADCVVCMTVTAASDNNLKAETLMQQIFSESEIAYDREKIKIQRVDLFADDMIPLDKFQTIA